MNQQGKAKVTAVLASEDKNRVLFKISSRNIGALEDTHPGP